jgi:hypothetical protein
MRKALLGLLFSLSICLVAGAQTSELAGVVGVKVTPSTSSAVSGTTTVNTSVAFEISLAHQFKSAPFASLMWEVPVMVTPSATVNTSNLLASKNYSSIYLTPGIKLKFTAGPINPWVAVGGGIAHFGPSTTSISGAASPASSTIKGVVSGGGGLDFKAPILPLTFRLEVREYFSGAPNLNIPQLSLHNNIFAGGGIVITF